MELEYPPRFVYLSQNRSIVYRDSHTTKEVSPVGSGFYLHMCHFLPAWGSFFFCSGNLSLTEFDSLTLERLGGIQDFREDSRFVEETKTPRPNINTPDIGEVFPELIHITDDGKRLCVFNLRTRRDFIVTQDLHLWAGRTTYFNGKFCVIYLSTSNFMHVFDIEKLREIKRFKLIVPEGSILSIRVFTPLTHKKSYRETSSVARERVLLSTPYVLISNHSHTFLINVERGQVVSRIPSCFSRTVLEFGDSMTNGNFSQVVDSKFLSIHYSFGMQNSIRVYDFSLKIRRQVPTKAFTLTKYSPSTFLALGESLATLHDFKTLRVLKRFKLLHPAADGPLLCLGPKVEERKKMLGRLLRVFPKKVHVDAIGVVRDFL